MDIKWRLQIRTQGRGGNAKCILSPVRVLDGPTHRFRLAFEEELFDVNRPLQFLAILAHAHLNLGHPVLTLGARGANGSQLLRSGVNGLINPGAFAVP